MLCNQNEIFGAESVFQLGNNRKCEGRTEFAREISFFVVLLNFLVFSCCYCIVNQTCVFFTAFFIRPFYKMMLGKPITLMVMESVVSVISKIFCRNDVV